eukprot:jgi/Ulvmu1/11091/UM070_0006.1
MACKCKQLGLPRAVDRGRALRPCGWAAQCPRSRCQPSCQWQQRNSRMYAKDELRSSQEPSSSSNKPVDTGLLPILGSMLAILASVAVLYVAAFSLGSGLVVQFKDQIGGVMKKDFVPYSERKALEYQLLEQRLSEQSAPAAGDAKVTDGGAVPKDQDFLTLLPT